MTPLVVEAIYENGVLKLKEALALPEGARVRIAVSTDGEADDPFEAVIGTCEGPPDGAANHDKYLYGENRP